MHLLNFSPVFDVSARGWLTTLNALGLEWDLHNYADFEGFDYLTTVTSSTLTLKWSIAERVIKWRNERGVPNEQGIPNYPSNRFCLVFSNVDHLEITPREPEMPKGEDTGLSSVSCMEAGEELTWYRQSGAFPEYDPRQETLPYHLVFRFNGGQIIRVGAEKAEFVLRD